MLRDLAPVSRRCVLYFHSYVLCNRDGFCDICISSDLFAMFFDAFASLFTGVTDKINYTFN